MSMYVDLLKDVLIGYVRKEGKKLRAKDADNIGKDDAAGRSLEAIASGLDTIDFSHIQEAKSLRNIGVALEAVGLKLQEEFLKILE